HVGVGDVFHLTRHNLALLRKLFLKLRHQGGRPLIVHLFVCGSGVMRHAVGDRRNGRQNRHQKQQKEFCAEAHCLAPTGGFATALPAPLGASSCSSHTSASRHSPHGDGNQLRTRASAAAKSGTPTSGSKFACSIICFSQA